MQSTSARIVKRMSLMAHQAPPPGSRPVAPNFAALAHSRPGFKVAAFKVAEIFGFLGR
jgi:hypothetical protein